ncbi:MULTISPECIES: GNAT family N-acetyltransferase [Megasphaera]|nr:MULTISPECIES: GNAT family N-acetyltransferase [Megasphaera]
MEFRIAEKQDRGLIEALWAYCFEPKEDPFFQWYFRHVYRPENVLLGFKNEALACLTHLNPYTLRLRGRFVETSYIVGLATHPAARHGGVGGKLLLAALEEMKRRHHFVNILMPSKAGFYQPYGYELYCHQWQETMPLEALRPFVVKDVRFAFLSDPDQWHYLADIYARYTADLSGYAVRNEESWRSHIAGQLAEGQIAVVFDGEQPIAYMFYKLGEPTINCGEFVYATAKGKGGLLSYLYNHRSQGTAVRWNEGLHDESYRFYPDGKEGHQTIPFMAGRIVDVKGALESVAYAPSLATSLTVAVADPLASWNTGTFTLTVQGGAATVEYTPQAEPAVSLSVGALALLLFGAVDAAALAFNGRLDGTPKAVEALQNIFPKTKCYINEWY